MATTKYDGVPWTVSKGRLFKEIRSVEADGSVSVSRLYAPVGTKIPILDVKFQKDEPGKVEPSPVLSPQQIFRAEAKKLVKEIPSYRAAMPPSHYREIAPNSLSLMTQRTWDLELLAPELLRDPEIVKTLAVLDQRAKNKLARMCLCRLEGRPLRVWKVQQIKEMDRKTLLENVEASSDPVVRRRGLDIFYEKASELPDIVVKPEK